MADPNQTPKQSNWACPCNGCQKAEQRERDQLIQFLEYMKHYEYEEEIYQIVIDMIKSRNPKLKKKK
jgi:hypothetical protein